MFEPPTTEMDSLAEHRFQRALRDYLRAVASAFGIGVESYTVDWDTPVSAYLALDEHLPHHPHRHLALLWQEHHGWSAAIESELTDRLLAAVRNRPAAQPRAQPPATGPSAPSLAPVC